MSVNLGVTEEAVREVWMGKGFFVVLNFQNVASRLYEW